jgi:hypothetical protein
VKDWELIADNLHDAGWSLGWVSALDLKGRTIWIVDAHRDDGKRFVVRADDQLSAFVELESAIHHRLEQRASAQAPTPCGRKHVLPNSFYGNGGTKFTWIAAFYVWLENSRAKKSMRYLAVE